MHRFKQAFESVHDQLDSKSVTKVSYFFNISVSEVLHFIVSTVLKKNGNASESVQE